MRWNNLSGAATAVMPDPVVRMADIAKDLASRIGPALLFAAIGIELMTLVSWLPDTSHRWWSADPRDFGDFRYFYDGASVPYPTGNYSPGLKFIMKPLASLSMVDAWRVYVGINAAGMLGVAYLAQRGVRSFEAKLAVFLGVLALPQTQWALRSGHFTPLLALLALSGFLLAERKPWLAGLCIGLLVAKPQYLPVPALFLLWTRNWKALLAMTGSLAALTGVGIMTIGLHWFMVQIGTIDVARLMDAREVHLPMQQAWQYSWQGFLISAGIEPNPLLVFDLIALSAAAVLLVWIKAPLPVAKAAAATGMLLLVPYSTFYNWCLLAVPAALLLRADLRPRFLTPAILGLGGIAAAATQNATPYPAIDMLAEGKTYGLYWIQPFALLSVFALAIAGQRMALATQGNLMPNINPVVAAIERARSIVRGRRRERSAPALAGSATTAMIIVAGAYFLSAYVSQNVPFAPDPFGRQAVLRALPDDFPAPPQAEVAEAGQGALLPYRVEWQSDQPAGEVAGLLMQKLNDGAWQVVLTEDDEGLLKVRAARFGLDGNMDLFGEVQVGGSEDGSAVGFEFVPLPTNRVPGFDEWIKKRDAAQPTPVAP